MEAERGRQVRISFTCRLEDGTPFNVEQRTLQLTLGKEQILPTLQDGVIGMRQGEQRFIKVPAGEVREYLNRQVHAAVVPRPAFGYDFGPGDGGDVLVTIPQPSGKPAPELPQGTDHVVFDVIVMAAEDTQGRKLVE